MLSASLIILISIITIYLVTIIILNRKGILKKYNLSLYGPFLLIKTDRGRNLIYKLSRRKRFWLWFGNVSMVICVAMMVTTVFLLLWQSWVLTGHLSKEVAEKLPGINMVLIIPVVNPLLPIGYTILAIIIAVVVHEFSHGISGASSGLRIKSMGVLAFIIPIGAFVEPDEEELKRLERKKRLRLFSAGPTANILVAMICLIIFSFGMMGQVCVASEGVGVYYVVKDSPAQEIGMEFGSIINEINGSKIGNIDDFLRIMNRTHANQSIEIVFYKNGRIVKKTVILADKYAFTQREEDRGKGFLGVIPSLNYRYELSLLKNPFTNFPRSFFYLYALPFSSLFGGFNPIIEPYTKFYEVKGIFSSNPSLFWSLANAIYWIFWLNLAVGLFNALPMIPLDGGYILQDVFEALLDRFRIESRRKEKIRKTVMVTISLFILFLVLYPLLLKYTYPLLH